MSGIKTRKRKQKEIDSGKYERVFAALEACEFTQKYRDTFLENEMDDDTVQKCIDNPQHFDFYLCAIIPKVGHKINFLSEFRKTKGKEGESSSSRTKKASTSFPGRIQQPHVFVNPNLRKVKMEVDYVPVKEEQEETENNNNDGEEEPEVKNSVGQLAKLTSSQDPRVKENKKADLVSVNAEKEETQNNNDGKSEVGNSKNPMAKPELNDVEIEQSKTSDSSPNLLASSKSKPQSYQLPRDNFSDLISSSYPRQNWMKLVKKLAKATTTITHTQGKLGSRDSSNATATSTSRVKKMSDLSVSDLKDVKHDIVKLLSTETATLDWNKIRVGSLKFTSDPLLKPSVIPEPTEIVIVRDSSSPDPSSENLTASTNQDWISSSGKIQVLPLDKLSDKESLEFILKELEIPESEIPEFKKDSREFIELIGGLPLALQQAVAFIKQQKELREFIGKSYEISDYVHEFKLSKEKFLSSSPVPGSSTTVFITWNVTFEKIQKLANGKKAVKLMEILSFLYADQIPSIFLHALVPEIQDEEFSAALKLLEKHSLIKMNEKDFCLSIHPQLQLVILQYLKECGDVSKVVMNISAKCKVVLKNIQLSKSSDIFLNVHHIVNSSFDLMAVNEKFLDFMGDFAKVLSEARRYSESLKLHRKVYHKYLELLGENHQKTFNSQHKIAVQLSQLEKYDEALTLYKEVLEKREIHVGPDHKNTINTKHNMASALRQQGNYEESLELFQQVLAQRNKIQGENHPSTLAAQHLIASLHSNLGDPSKALALYEAVEKKRTEVLGPDHEEVLTTKYNKAGVLFKMGKFQEASKIFNEVHEKRKKLLGESHLCTIDALFWIGTISEKEGKFTEALEIYQKVYEMKKANVGADHRLTIDVKTKIENAESKLREKNASL